ncbi:DsbA family protein [Candidatus Micrarchaeota archaeon]|nr:DsbA family protein [Candidatus Micrarchaeota archaeon]
MPQKAIMVLAVALVVSSLILSYAVVTSADSIGKGLSKIQVTAGPGSGSGTLQPTATPAPQVDYRDLIQDFAGAEGDENAPVTIVEFSDYQCPFCRSFFESSLPQIREQYVNTGKVRIVFKDFPLSFHPDAPKAAEAARCAGDQGKYFDMHDAIYQGQGPANLGTVTINESVYATYAKQLGLNEAQFQTCLDSGKFTQAVQGDFAQGVAAGVSGTPSFYVNNQLLVGAQPFSVFKQAIDAELSNA